jgi:TrmH family RNA methyltransferase
MSVLRSRDNPRVKRWARLARDAGFRRKEQATLLEGPRLLEEALAAGLEPLAVVASESAVERPEIRKLATVVVSDSLFRLIGDAENPQGVAAELAIPDPAKLQGKSSVFLEGIQDPGNAGGIIRSAAAFGIGEVVLDRGCADPWSPKALRAGMGGHFRLSVRQTASLAGELAAFEGRIVCASPRGGQALRGADLSGRLGWLFGGEGQGVSEALSRQAHLLVSIPMQGGVESLNVAASVAVCLYESSNRPDAGS